MWTSSRREIPYVITWDLKHWHPFMNLLVLFMNFLWFSTAFHCAASSQHDDSEIMTLLLNSVKGNVDEMRFSILKTTDTGGNTALHCAVSCENRQIIQTILSKVPLTAAKELMLMKNKSRQNIYDIAREKTCEDTLAHLHHDHRQLAKSTRTNLREVNGKLSLTLSCHLLLLTCSHLSPNVKIQ